MEDMFVLRTCLALHSYFKALFCSCSHCFALSCWRDGEAVYSIVGEMERSIIFRMRLNGNLYIEVMKEFGLCYTDLN